MVFRDPTLEVGEAGFRINPTFEVLAGEFAGDFFLLRFCWAEI